MAIKNKYKTYTTNGTKVAVARSCNVTDIFAGTDDTNDISIQLYDHASAASGSSPIGPTTIKADYEGFQGLTGVKIPMELGAVLVISNIGTGWVTIGYNLDMCF
jgi:hypothetical protein